MKKNNCKKFFKKYAFYMVLAICVLSVGGTVFAAVQKMSTPPVKTPEILTTTTASEEVKVGVPVSGINRDDEKTNTQTSTTKIPEMTTTTHIPTTESEDSLNASAGKPFESYFMQPIGNGISKVFSNSELVYSETMQDWRTHDGIDLKGDKGMAIRAITNGTVLDVYENPLLGIVVEINHGNGVIARYCGLDKNPPVQKGAPVEMGDAIGLIGEIPMESLEQSHVHLEVEINGQLVDPETLFN